MMDCRKLEIIAGPAATLDGRARRGGTRVARFAHAERTAGMTARRAGTQISGMYFCGTSPETVQRMRPASQAPA